MGVRYEVICYIILTHYGTHYCGITNSLTRRWKEHVSGQSKYLSIYKPKEVVWIEVYPDYKAAAQREKQIKKFGVGKFFKKWKIQSGYYGTASY
jgi:predicted GIY-YIG superfamily endonuclease